MKAAEPFLIALQFLTRLPVRLRAKPQTSAVGRSLAYYPLVGLMIGLGIVGLSRLIVDAPATLRAALVLAVWVVITGALHLDGLADSADAWIGGHSDRDRTLAIMKDPASGPAAVVTLVIVLLTKFAALQELSPDDWRLALIPMLARATVPLLFETTPYVRPGGIGSRMAMHRSLRANTASLVLTVVATLAIARIDGLVLLAVGAVIFFGLRATMIRRIGGTTGDTAGALIELSETGLLVALVLM
jgi:adenosylcobinamide-GDP ribazoletransferase